MKKQQGGKEEKVAIAREKMKAKSKMRNIVLLIFFLVATIGTLMMPTI